MARASSAASARVDPRRAGVEAARLGDVDGAARVRPRGLGRVASPASRGSAVERVQGRGDRAGLLGALRCAPARHLGLLVPVEQARDALERGDAAQVVGQGWSAAVMASSVEIGLSKSLEPRCDCHVIRRGGRDKPRRTIALAPSGARS